MVNPYEEYERELQARGEAPPQVEFPSEAGDVAPSYGQRRTNALVNHTRAMTWGTASHRGSRYAISRRDLPAAVFESYDWAVRCDATAGYLLNARHVEQKMQRLMEMRIASLSPFRNPIPAAWKLDLAFARASREAGYVNELRQLMASEELAETEALSPDLLCFTEPLVSNDRTDLGWYARPDMINRQAVLPVVERRFERRSRHVHRVLVPFHCKEVEALSAAGISTKYVNIPSWWARREGSYSENTELPPSLAYIGSTLMSPDAQAWNIVLTEWTALRAAEVVMSARAGRLLWIPEIAIRDIEELGLDQIFYYNDHRVIQDARECLDWIRKIDWARTSPLCRHLPGSANEITPTFQSGGDWVPWDPVAWKPVEELQTLPDMARRPVVVNGSCDHLPQEGYPSGRAAAAGTSDLDHRRSRVTGVKRRMLEEADRVLRLYLDADVGLRALVQAHAPGRPIRYFGEFVAAVKKGLTASSTEAMVVDTESVPGTGTAGSVDEPAGDQE